jgi:hypothetical protein
MLRRNDEPTRKRVGSSGGGCSHPLLGRARARPISGWSPRRPVPLSGPVRRGSAAARSAQVGDEEVIDQGNTITELQR